MPDMTSTSFAVSLAQSALALKKLIFYLTHSGVHVTRATFVSAQVPRREKGQKYPSLCFSLGHLSVKAISMLDEEPNFIILFNIKYLL